MLEIQSSYGAGSDLMYGIHRYTAATRSTDYCVCSSTLLVLQEILPSGEAGSAVTMGDYVRDVFLEQVWPCNLTYKYSVSAALLSTLL